MAHVLACKRVAVRDLCKVDDDGNITDWGVIPPKYTQALEQNQLIKSCCRHPENHDIEAFWSSPEERGFWAMGEPDGDNPPPVMWKQKPPDIYKLHCKCGSTHVRFCVGGDNPATGEKDFRPMWDIR
jgi:hypothetical protein